MSSPVPPKPKKKGLDAQLKGMADEFDDPSKPWNNPDIHAGDTPKVAPKAPTGPAPSTNGDYQPASDEALTVTQKLAKRNKAIASKYGEK